MMTIEKLQQVTVGCIPSSPIVTGVGYLRPLENGGNHSQRSANGTKPPSYGNIVGNITNNIIDIRKERIEYSLVESLRTSIKGTKDKGPCLPTMLLWNEKGLKLFEAVTHLDEYYLNHVEMDILEQRSDDIARRIKPKSMLIDLGSGQVLIL